MAELDPRLQSDCREIARLGLCRLLLMLDANYPWFILVPDRHGVTEIHQLEAGDRHRLIDESWSRSCTCITSRATATTRPGRHPCGAGCRPGPTGTASELPGSSACGPAWWTTCAGSERVARYRLLILAHAPSPNTRTLTEAWDESARYQLLVAMWELALEDESLHESSSSSA